MEHLLLERPCYGCRGTGYLGKKIYNKDTEYFGGKLMGYGIFENEIPGYQSSKLGIQSRKLTGNGICKPEINGIRETPFRDVSRSRGNKSNKSQERDIFFY